MRKNRHHFLSKDRVANRYRKDAYGLLKEHGTHHLATEVVASAEAGAKQIYSVVVYTRGNGRGMKERVNKSTGEWNGIASRARRILGAPPMPQPAEGRLKSGREGEHEASSQRLI